MKLLAPILALFNKERIVQFFGGAPAPQVQKCVGFGSCSNQMLNDLSKTLSSRYNSIFNGVPSSSGSPKVCEIETLFRTLRAGASELGEEAKKILAAAASAAVLHPGKVGVAVGAVALALAVPKIRAYLSSRHDCLNTDVTDKPELNPNDQNNKPRPQRGEMDNFWLIPGNDCHDEWLCMLLAQGESQRRKLHAVLVDARRKNRTVGSCPSCL